MHERENHMHKKARGGQLISTVGIEKGKEWGEGKQRRMNCAKTRVLFKFTPL